MPTHTAPPRWPHDVKTLAAMPQPAMSLYIDLREAPGSHGGEVMLRWHELRDAARAAGASEAALARVDEALPQGAPFDRVFAVFATADQLVSCRQLEDFHITDGVWWGVPHLGPLFSWHQEWAPALVVQINRQGAEIVEYDGPAPSRSEVVIGPDDEIEHNAPGGWSQPRYQRRGEDSWSNNARAVAERVAHLARVRPGDVVIVAGDTHAVTLFQDHLPSDVRERIHLTHADGGHLPEHPAQIKAETINQIRRESAAARRVDSLARLDDAGAAGRAVEGIADVQACLESGRAEELVVVDDAIPTSADQLIVYACATDLPLRVVHAADATLVDGIGAVLRY